MFALSSFLSGVSSDPVLLVSQIFIVLLACLLLFLLFYALRDILQRSHSLFYQFLSIVLVALLPIVGFLLYLLIRPARTVSERQTDKKVADLWDHFCTLQEDNVPHRNDDDTHVDASVSPSPPSL